MRSVLRKTHHTAVVLMPPADVWPPLQAIRQRHDRHARRWVMPHITLLYPFRPRDEFPAVAEQLAVVCWRLAPFPLLLREWRYFDHGRGSYTLWLVPEPMAAVQRLQAALQDVVPDCDDVCRYPRGFTPHLSLAQAQGQAMRQRLQDMLQATWQPLSFMVEAIQLIWRQPPADDVFRVDRTIRLGKSLSMDLCRESAADV
jgi:2'-5' RNA ligase